MKVYLMQRVMPSKWQSKNPGEQTSNQVWAEKKLQIAQGNKIIKHVKESLLMIISRGLIFFELTFAMSFQYLLG